MAAAARPEWCALLGGDGALAVGGGDAGALHQQGDLVHLGLCTPAFRKLAQGGVVAADNLLEGGLAANLVVTDAGAYHIDTHIGRALVGALAVDVLEQGVHHGENLHVTVVVDGRLPIGVHMEGVYHIHIVKVGRGGFVGDVDGMVQGEAPDREGFELGIAGFDSAAVFLV